MRVRSLRVLFLACSLAVAGSPLLAQGPDVLILHNGDRLTGKFKRMERGRVFFSADIIDGTVKVDWDLIEGIESERAFQLRTRGGKTFRGSVERVEAGASPEDARNVVMVSGDRSVEFKESEIANVTQVVKRLPGLLEARVSFGMTIAKSNDQRQYNAEATISYETPKNRAVVDLSSIFGTQTAEEQEDGTRPKVTTNRQNVTASFSRYLGPRWGLAGRGDFLQSDQQQLDLRTTLGGGPFFELLNTHRMQLYGVGALVWNNERFSSESSLEPINNNLEGAAALQFYYFQFKQWSLDTQLYVYPSITSVGRVRMDWRTNLRLRIIPGKPLWWNLTQIVNLDNNPPAFAPGTDYVTLSSLSWTFP